MAKVSALNTRIYMTGTDLSGDASSLDGVGYSNNVLDVSTLDSGAPKRIIGSVNGSLSVSAWFDAAANRVHAVMTANSGKVPTTDQILLIPTGAAVGSDSYHIVGKLANYDVSMPEGGTAPVAVSATVESSTYAPQMGKMLTAHDDTHSSATNGDAVDNSASSANGGNAVLQVFSLASGTATVKVQHSANNSTWADLVTFTAVTDKASEYKAVTGTVNRYLRVASTGTFSNLVLAVDFARD